MRARVAAIVWMAALVAAGCGRPDDPGPAAGGGAPAPEGALPELERAEVALFFPREDGTGLQAEPRSVVKVAEPGALAKQVLAELIAGPQGAGLVRAVPPETTLRQVYVADGGVAYADFGPELRSGLGGGSAAELAAVYAVVDSLAWNVPGVERVAILVEGAPAETLNGHMDLTRPLSPRRDLVRGEVPARVPAPGPEDSGRRGPRGAD